MNSLGWVVIVFGVAAFYVFLRYDLYDATALKWKSPSDLKTIIPTRPYWFL